MNDSNSKKQESRTKPPRRFDELPERIELDDMTESMSRSPQLEAPREENDALKYPG